MHKYNNERGRNNETASSIRRVQDWHPYTFAFLQAVPDIDRRSALSEAVAEPERSTEVRAYAFAGRCPWQLGALCEEAPPPWREVSGTHRICCHHKIEDLAALAAGELNVRTTN